MEGLSTNNVLSNLNNFPRLTKSIAITLSVFLFLGIICNYYNSLEILTLNVVYIAPPRFYLWTFFTASLTETSIISGIFNIVALLFIGKYLEPIWGSREFIKFILVVIFFSSLCSFFFFVFKFMFFGGIDLIMKANVCGFSGVIAAFSVALKQLITEQEFNFFLIKIRAKWIPFILILFRVIVFSFIGFQDRSFTLVIYGVFIAWIYLRFYQVKSGVKGDLNESFSFYTFFPDPVQAPIKVISNIVFKILCKLSICSSSRFSNQSILPTTNNNNINNNDDSYNVADMERRRALAVKALEERMQQQQQHQQQQQYYTQHQQPQQQYYPQQHQHQPQQMMLQTPQQYYPPPSVIVKTIPAQDESHFNSSLIFFVLGFFISCLWLINIRYLKSRNKNAKTLATVSIVMFFVYLVFVFILVVASTSVSYNSRYYQ